MKTNYLFGYVKFFTIYTLVFLWAAFKVNAQCPTVNDTSPLILDASGYTFADLSADFVIDNGGGISWYSNSTGGILFNPTQLVSEGTYYADDNSGSCGSRTSVIVDFQVNRSGQPLDGIYCSNENPTVQTYIDDVLEPNKPSGGSIEVYNDYELTDLANPADLLSGFYTYYIIFIDGLGKSQIEFGDIIVVDSPSNPTPSGSQIFCSDTNPTISNLDPGTILTFKWYQGLDGFGNPILPALSPSTALVNGHTYYVVSDSFCDSDPVSVLVTLNPPVDAGTSTALEYCDDSISTTPSFDLFNELGGTPDTNGTWSGPLPTTNGNLGTVDISTLTAGIYTFIYTVPSNGACPPDSANITITVYETFTSGTVSPTNPATFCESTAPTAFDLFSLLDNEDLNGQWTQGTLSTDPVVTSLFDLTTLTPATYNFTYTQNISIPCPEESTTVQVIILPDPNAGNAISQTFCENDLVANSPFNLFDALDSSQDSNSGTWTDASNATISNLIDITGFTVAGSPYSFNYTIDNGTCSNTETITITVQPAPESGIANAPEVFCEGDVPANFNLFDLLTDEDQTGTWYVGTDNLGAIIANPVDLSAYTANTYNFTYDVDAIGSCDDILVTVSVIINPLPNTGTPIAAVFCENDLTANSPLDLFGQLTGEDLGGTWTDDDTTGALSGSNVDLTLLTIGSYNFTYTIVDPNNCTNSSTVSVTVEDAPESGTANTPVEFCLAAITTGQTFNLFDLLTGEDQTGTWSDDDATGLLTGNMVTLDGLAQGTYNFTYDVAAIGTCDDINITVSIIINDTPAPTALATQEFCDTATVADLVATGTTIQWYGNATGGTPLVGTTALVDGEDYFASQTNAITGCESSVRTAVITTIYQSPNAGNPATPIIACSTDTNVDLNTGLDGTQDLGGVWQDTDGTGALTGNIFDATQVTPGTYQFTYNVTASAPCVDDNTVITITVEAPLSAGTDGVLDVCNNNGTTDLFTLIGSADVGGSWSPALASGTGVFDPLVDAPGTYTYSLNNACGTVSSDVVVTVTQAPNAGTDNTANICVINGVTDLFQFLGSSAQTGGTWSPALTSGTGAFNPLVDTAGVYTYTVTAIAPCLVDSSAQIMVTISDSPAPIVLDANPEFCLADNPTVSDLNSAIRVSGTISWYADATLATPLNTTDALVNGEDYFARQTTGSGCESSQGVEITATVNNVATPTLINSNLELCINDGPTISELTENISEYDSSLDNVIWYDAATGGSSFTNSDLLSYGVTYYAALYDATTACESSVRLAYEPDLTSCGELVLPDGFSPNGDGTNDTFDYNNLDILHPNFSIEIFNRYGTVVYKGNASTPRFDGTANQSGAIGSKQLPVGVYFYIFNFNDGTNKPKQGRLYLSR
ncbi:gliding motility-associated C-terminal domain-containing protein [Confluentibacter citreus]|uniref:gliding motility-associated C-terminal domain-containing protein n=1 Tax=Confluentibacter citreus TaxID=2007307 RepID=UPI000C2899BB|nr:gliding motility-associated C-terminal domain-containing protein [Confluentibacter citreus]